MRKTVIVGAAALCLLLGSSAVAYAAGALEIPSIKGPDMGTGTIPVEIDALQSELAEVRESASDMSAYAQYGLFYNQDIGGYCYNGKLVGLFVDKQGRGISFLNQNGEVHVKAVRDDNGNLTGLAELSADEYRAIISDMDMKVADLEAQLEKDFAEMELFMGEGLPNPPKPEVTNGLAPADLEQHMNEVSANLEQHMNEISANLQQHMKGIKLPSPPSLP